MSSTDDLFEIESSKRSRTAFKSVPLLILVVSAVLLGHPATRVHARPWLLYENSPVEILTFAFFLLGGLGGLALAARARRAGVGTLTAAFYVVFSVGLICVAGEEIAWGQWFFHWVTPAGWRAFNVQGETTLHNVSGLNDYLPILHIIFAVGALVGIQAARVRALVWVATPPVLFSWFVLVGVHVTLELLTGILWRNTVVHKIFERTSELVEMYLAIAAFLYVFLNARRLGRHTNMQTSWISPMERSRVVETLPAARRA
jgi:hypothetical protein